MELNLDGRLQIPGGRLPEEMKDVKEVNVLVLTNNCIKTLPGWIGNYEKLTYLKLNSNLLEELPREIVMLKCLQVLYINHNKLRVFPREILELGQLSSLSVGGNCLEKLPSDIERLENLEFLEIYGNALTELPRSIGSLKHLTYLSALSNKLTEFPEWILEMESLGCLDLSWNPNLVSLPKDIGNMKLCLLNLSGTGLKVLPVSVKKLVGKLTRLDLTETVSLLPRGKSGESLGWMDLEDLFGSDSKVLELPPLSRRRMLCSH